MRALLYPKRSVVDVLGASFKTGYERSESLIAFVTLEQKLKGSHGGKHSNNGNVAATAAAYGGTRKGEGN